MFRLKSQQSPPALPVRRLWTVGASASVALSSYVLVGHCIHQVAGSATLISVIISSLLAFVTGFAYVELTQRTRVTGSPYSFCYTYLGELPAFVVGWAVVGECAIGAALMGKAVTYYASFLSGDRIVNALIDCCSLGEVEPKLWHFFDPLAMSAVIVVGVVCAINSQLACKINQGLLLVNFITVVFVIVLNVVKGSSDNWENSNGTSIFVPEEFGAHGVFQASAIYMHVFLTLATTATLATQARGAAHSVTISMVVTFIVACIAVIRATSVSLLQPYDQLNDITPVASYMNETDQQWVANLNCCGALGASFAGILSMLVLSANTLEQMASDGLLWSRLAAKRPSISPAITTLITTAVAAIGAAFQDYEGLIRCLSSGTFLVFQALLISVMVSRSHASRETALLIVLKFTWLLYFFVSPALVVITNRFSKKKQVQSAIQGILSGVVLMFLQLAINRRLLGVKVICVQVLTSFVMGFSSYLMYQLDNWAWYRLYIWTVIGVLIYTLYGYRKSNLGRGIVDLTVVPEDECVRSLELGVDNPGFQQELAELGVGRLRRTQRSLGGHSYASARSRHRQSFHSAHEEDAGRQSFRSVREPDPDQQSFKSFQGSWREEQSSGRGSGGSAVEDALQSAAVHGTTGPQPAPPAAVFASFRSSRSDDSGERRRPRRTTGSSYRSAVSGSDGDGSQGWDAVDLAAPAESDAEAEDGWYATIGPGAGQKASPPSSRPATPGDLTRTPPAARRAAPVQRSSTPATSTPRRLDDRDATAADLRGTPPSSRRRSGVEILINPRRLCEEMYPAAPAERRAAPVSGPGHPDTPGGPGQKTTGAPRVAAPEDSDTDDSGERFSLDSASLYSDESQGRPAAGPGAGTGGRGAPRSPSISDVSYDDTPQSRPAPALRHAQVASVGQTMSDEDDGETASSDSTSQSSASSGTPYSRARPPTPTQPRAEKQSQPRAEEQPQPLAEERRTTWTDVQSQPRTEEQRQPRAEEQRPLQKEEHSQPLAEELRPSWIEEQSQPRAEEPQAGAYHEAQPEPDRQRAASSPDSSPELVPSSAFHLLSPARFEEGASRTNRPGTSVAQDRDSLSSAGTSSDQRSDRDNQRSDQDDRGSDQITSDSEESRTGSGGHQIQDDIGKDQGSDKTHRVTEASDHDDPRPQDKEQLPSLTPQRNPHTPSGADDLRPDEERPSSSDSESSVDELDEHPLPCDAGRLTPLRSETSAPSDENGPGLPGREADTGSERSADPSEPSDSADEVSSLRSETAAVPSPGRERTLSPAEPAPNERAAFQIEATQGSDSEGRSRDTWRADSDSGSSSGDSGSVRGGVARGSRSPSPSRPAAGDRSDSARSRSASAASSSSSSSEAELEGQASDSDDSCPPTGPQEQPEEPEEPDELRPVVRRQMRLPPVPADSRWLARTPTPPDLLAALSVAPAAPQPTSLGDSQPSLAASGSQSDDSETWPDLAPAPAPARPEPAPASPGRTPSPAGVGRSRSAPPTSGGSSDGGNSSSSSSSDGSPVPLRRHRPPSPRPAGRVTSLQPPPAARAPRSPITRVGSLPQLNPTYRAIYRPAEQLQLVRGAARRPEQRARQTFVRDSSDRDEQRARETFVHEPDDERAQSFVATPPTPSEGLRVRPELDSLSWRLTRRAAAERPEHGPAESGDAGAADGRRPPAAADRSPDLVYC